jgi:hypothetical protein
MTYHVNTAKWAMLCNEMFSGTALRMMEKLRYRVFSNHANDLDIRKSIIGFAIFLNDAVVAAMCVQEMLLC